jgi:hypothetical protein
MKSIDQSVATKIREVFQAKHDDLVNLESRKILISHYGTFSQDLVGSLSNSVEELLVSIGDKKTVIKRMFSILLEGLQNIRIHGGHDAKGKQLGFLLIASSDEDYKIVMANIMGSHERDRVENYLNEINGLSDTEIKEKYISVLSNEFLSQKGGAGLGFITTRMKSGKLGYSFDVLDDVNELFSLVVTLPRKK